MARGAGTSRRGAPSPSDVQAEGQRSSKRRRAEQATQRGGEDDGGADGGDPILFGDEDVADVEGDARSLAAVYGQQADAARERSKLTPAEVDSLVAAVVRHVLFRQHARRGEPIPRQELADVVSRGTAKRATAVVLPAAQQRLAAVFGLHLKEVARRTTGNKGAAAAAAAAAAATATQGGGGAGGGIPSNAPRMFLLRSLVPPKLRREHLQGDGSDDDGEEGSCGDGPQQALALLVLALVRVNSEKMTEDELWRMLEELGVRRDAPHPRFGDAGAQLAAMVRRRFLVESRVMGADGEVKVYEWGEAAADQLPGDAVDKWAKRVVSKSVGQATQQQAEGDE